MGTDYIFGWLVPAGILIIVAVLFSKRNSKINSKKAAFAIAAIQNDVILKVSDCVPHYSEFGFKKVYPRMGKLDIYLTGNEALFVAKSEFNNTEIPFAISKNPIATKRKLNLLRVFSPTRVSREGKTLAIDFTDDLFIASKIYFSADLKGNDVGQLDIMKDWIK
jgi:hypothetical protein